MVKNISVTVFLMVKQYSNRYSHKYTGVLIYSMVEPSIFKYKCTYRLVYILYVKNAGLTCITINKNTVIGRAF